jgi:hypothetical protein
MADYYKILTGAIAQQGIEDSGARQALYDRVRKVLESQLAGLDQEKSAPIAEQHRKTLDDAIAKIEAVSVDIVSGATPKIEPTLPEQKAEDRPIPPSVAVPESTNDASDDAPSDTAKDSTPETSSPSQAGAYVAPPQSMRTVEPNIPVAGSDRATPAGGYLRPPTTSERVAAESKTRRHGARNFFVGLILLLAILAGLGFWQRDNLDAYAGPVFRAVGEYTTMASNKIGELTGLWGITAAPSADGEDTATGDPDTVLPPVEVATPQSLAEESGEDGVGAPADDAPVQVASAPPETPAVEPPEVTIVEPSQPAPPTATETLPATTVVESQTPPAPAAPSRPDAFLLIEGNASEGQQDDRVRGTASWSLGESDEVMRIEAQMTNPGSSLVIEIAKNEDSALPATHTVTYTYTPSESQPDGPITNFPSLMTRVDDTSASVPLRGVGALILPNQYLMGLSDKPEDREFNLQLLENAKWIVVPVVFETGRRGLFLIEFGEEGREVYAAARAAWGDAN